MTRQQLFDIQINSFNADIYKRAKYEWDHMSKPIDGMGDFEEVVCKIAAIQNSIIPNIDNRALLVFCADNGIVENGVTQCGQDVTWKVAKALGEGISTSNSLAKSVNTKVVAVDVGINFTEKLPGVLDYKVSTGTKNFICEPAMTEEQLLKAIEAGIECVRIQAESGVKLIASGEMGIGNTTTSAAVLTAVLDIDSDDIVGRGAGLNDEGLKRKRVVVKTGINNYQDIFAGALDEKNRCFDILRCLGGFDIASLTGAFIGGAIYGIPVIIDGLISAVAALLSNTFVHGVSDYMIASHSGREKGVSVVLKRLGMTPYINGNMALGEGTGALMLISLLDSALFLYKNGIKFNDAGIDDYERFE